MSNIIRACAVADNSEKLGQPAEAAPAAPCPEAEAAIDAVVDAAAFGERQVCDEPPLPRVVAFRDDTKTIDLKWRE